MKQIFVWFLAFCMPVVVLAQQSKIAIIPQPVSVLPQQGNFSFDNSIVIQAPAGAGVQYVTDYLQSKLGTATGIPVTVQAAANNAAIQLLLNKNADTTLGKEGYKLSVTPQGITISANQPAGLFYGVQTLVQLMPQEIESDTVVHRSSWTIPAVEITDYPRFGWRGLMFDVARHFFTKAEVKDFIDQMVKYKLNLLHLHLTDDEGWRIEIKSLPKLTEVGAWNVKKEGYFGTFSAPGADEPRDYGGFYTQEDIKELVQYAKERFVNILPEVDVPGHSLAAIAAYPELACSGGVEHYGVASGESIKDWSTHTALVDDNLCPANENVYVFLDKVITELAQLFPFEYIHMGGDETFKTYWEKSDAVKALMKKEKLKNMEEVQSYFTKRVEKIVASKGKKFMGWDEILEGGLAPNAAVMSWRGVEGGIEAAKQKHEVVMSPTTFAYLDFMQGDQIVEPRVYASLRLKKAYEFEPVPEGVDPKYIKGGQGNLWSEQLFNVRHMQYMLWPRAMAIAESVWSPKSVKDWNHFVDRVEQQFPRFDVANVKYAPSIYDPSFDADTTADGRLRIRLIPEANNLDIYYSFDNSFPDRFYPKYAEPIIAPKDAVMLKVITYRGNQPMGRMIAMPLSELRKRVGNNQE